jgi:hypothetical protein
VNAKGTNNMQIVILFDRIRMRGSNEVKHCFTSDQADISNMCALILVVRWTHTAHGHVTETITLN